MKIKILAEGGELKPGPALSQKLGPAGINLNAVISTVNEATKAFKGLKVPVELDVNISTKEFTVEVFSPPVSELLKKELGVEKGSGAQAKLFIGNLSIEQIISVAKTKLPNLLSKTLKTAVKTVVGTCVSLGILVESKSPVEIEAEIEEGKYDKEINEEKTEPTEEKKAELKEYFDRIKGEQEKVMKIEKATKEAEDEKKTKKDVPAPDAKKEVKPEAKKQKK